MQRLQAKLQRQVSSLSRSLDRLHAARPEMEQALTAASAQLDSYQEQIQVLLRMLSFPRHILILTSSASVFCAGFS